MNKKITAILAVIATMPILSLAADNAPNASANAASTQCNAPAATTLADTKAATNLIQAVPALENFSMNLTLGFETEYVFRGIQCAAQSFQPDLNMAYDLGNGFSIVGDIWSNAPIKNKDSDNEIDLYAGLAYSYKMITVNAGYVYYWYPRHGEDSLNHSNEAQFTVEVDTSDWLGQFNITPSVGYFYDFDYDCNTIEAALSYSAPISKWLVGDEYLSLETSVYYGYCFYGNLGADGGNGAYYDTGEPIYKQTAGYGYFGVSSDLVLQVTDFCSVSVGIRYTHTNAGELAECKEDQVWMGSAVSFGF